MSLSVNGSSAGSLNSAMSGVSLSTGKNSVTSSAGGFTKSTTKKALNYNSKEISSQLMRAHKSRNASMVLSRAKSKVSMLRRCLGTGQYNDNEVRIALAHANKMVKTAQMKVTNLKEEEQMKKSLEREHKNEERQQKNEMKRRVSQKQKDIKLKAQLEENQQVLKEKSMRQEILRKRRLHRNSERNSVNEADMEYLKNKMDEQKGCYVDTSGVMVEFSAQAVELQMSEHAMQVAEEQLGTDANVQMNALSGGDMSTGANINMMI